MDLQDHHSRKPSSVAQSHYLQRAKSHDRCEILCSSLYLCASLSQGSKVDQPNRGGGDLVGGWAKWGEFFGMMYTSMQDLSHVSTSPSQPPPNCNKIIQD